MGSYLSMPNFKSISVKMAVTVGGQNLTECNIFFKLTSVLHKDRGSSTIHLNRLKRKFSTDKSDPG